MFRWDQQTVLVTGGTGTFGRECVAQLLALDVPRIVVFSRSESRQWDMRNNGFDQPQIRWFIGDVRDRDRLWRALKGVTVCIHAAAMKFVPACRYNPIEAIRTNIDGTVNVIDACLDRDVERLMFISTDKAVAACTLYGSTKATAEHLVVEANAYQGTRCSAARYGNVIGSTGSIVPLFREQAKTGTLTITHPDATRFWVTIRDGVRFVLHSLANAVGGEVFVPDLPAATVGQIAQVVAPDAQIEIIGLRSGEKMHEQLVAPDEYPRTVKIGGAYVVLRKPSSLAQATAARHRSDQARRLSDDELAQLIAVA